MPNRSIWADEDDRIWIKEAPTPTTETLNVYAVFDRKGQFLDRIRMPSGQTVVGFGPGGQVYLAIMDGGRVQLARARFK